MLLLNFFKGMVNMMIKYQNRDQQLIDDAINIVKLGKNLLLKGPTGTGKTRLSENISESLSTKQYSVNCSVDLDAESLLGFKTIETIDGVQQIVFIDGPVIKAMKEGAILYIDEINMAKPEVLPILNSVLDYRRKLTNPFNNEVVIAQKGFNVIAAINEGYVGTMPMNEALVNRFVAIELKYIDGETLKQVLIDQSILTDEQDIENIIKLNELLIKMVSQHQISEEVASVRALIDACDLMTIMPFERAIERALVSKLETDREKEAIRQLFELI